MSKNFGLITICGLCVLIAAGRGCDRPLSAQAATQPTSADRFIAKLLQNRTALSVSGGRLSGAGASVLESALAQSRFVLLGEDHGIAQTPQFWAAVCATAGPAGFHTMAVEEGPLVAAELEGLARRPDGVAQLTVFEKTFPGSMFDPTRTKNSTCCSRARGRIRREFHLWGLNHEGLNAGGLILSRVLASNCLGEQARPAMQQLLEKNDEAYRKALQSGSIFDMFMIAADDKALAAGAALLQKDGSVEARTLFASLVESHEMNLDAAGAVRQRSPARAPDEDPLCGRLRARGKRRGGAAEGPPEVRWLSRYRGLNPVHGSGIGNYVAEFAEAQGAQSLHIRLMPVKGSATIYPRVGQPAQQMSFNYADQPGSRYLQPILSNLLPSDWTMFDLRPLRQDLSGPGRAIDPELATLVFGYDVLVMVPEATPATEIR